MGLQSVVHTAWNGVPSANWVVPLQPEGQELCRRIMRLESWLCSAYPDIMIPGGKR